MDGASEREPAPHRSPSVRRAIQPGSCTQAALACQRLLLRSQRGRCRDAEANQFALRTDVRRSDSILVAAVVVNPDVSAPE